MSIINTLPPLSPVGPAPATSGGAAPAASTASFSDALERAIEGVREGLGHGDEQATGALVGQKAPHEATLALTEAELSLRFLVQVRSKAIEAYQEIMRMSI